jgi:hypothetical protein
MMKKVLLVVLCLMVATAAFAQTSGPSNTVGYVKFTTTSGTVASPAYTPFGLPFKFWVLDGSGVPQYSLESAYPSDIIGDQATSGSDPNSPDQVISQSGGFAFRLNGTWVGALQNSPGGMLPGRAFWFMNKAGVAEDIVLAGEVDNSGGYGSTNITVAPSSSIPSYAPISWRDSRNLAPADLNLPDDGFLGGNGLPDAAAHSDQILSQNSGFAIYDATGDVWAPPSFMVQPGKAYWIVNKHTGNAWTYTYDGAPAAAMTVGSHEGSVSRAISTPSLHHKVTPTTSVKHETSRKAEHSSKTNAVHQTNTKKTSNKSGSLSK